MSGKQSLAVLLFFCMVAAWTPGVSEDAGMGTPTNVTVVSEPVGELPLAAPEDGDAQAPEATGEPVILAVTAEPVTLPDGEAAEPEALFSRGYASVGAGVRIYADRGCGRALGRTAELCAVYVFDRDCREDPSEDMLHVAFLQGGEAREGWLPAYRAGEMTEAEAAAFLAGWSGDAWFDAARTLPLPVVTYTMEEMSEPDGDNAAPAGEPAEQAIASAALVEEPADQAAEISSAVEETSNTFAETADQVENASTLSDQPDSLLPATGTDAVPEAPAGDAVPGAAEVLPATPTDAEQPDAPSTVTDLPAATGTDLTDPATSTDLQDALTVWVEVVDSRAVYRPSDTITMRARVQEASGALHYQWQYALPDAPQVWLDVDGAQGETYTFTITDENYVYLWRVSVTEDDDAAKE